MFRASSSTRCRRCPSQPRTPVCAELSDNAATRLFVDRVRAVDPTFELTRCHRARCRRDHPQGGRIAPGARDRRALAPAPLGVGVAGGCGATTRREGPSGGGRGSSPQHARRDRVELPAAPGPGPDVAGPPRSVPRRRDPRCDPSGVGRAGRHRARRARRRWSTPTCSDPPRHGVGRRGSACWRPSASTPRSAWPPQVRRNGSSACTPNGSPPGRRPWTRSPKGRSPWRGWPGPGRRPTTFEPRSTTSTSTDVATSSSS